VVGSTPSTKKLNFYQAILGVIIKMILMPFVVVFIFVSNPLCGE
jgi:hypothetical protein